MSLHRVRRHRLRKTGQLPPVTTCSCGARALGDHAPLCYRCWLATPDGKASEAERKRQVRGSDKHG